MRGKGALRKPRLSSPCQKPNLNCSRETRMLRFKIPKGLPTVGCVFFAKVSNSPAPPGFPGDAWH